jgi:hypothetical protein
MSDSVLAFISDLFALIGSTAVSDGHLIVSALRRLSSVVERNFEISSCRRARLCSPFEADWYVLLLSVFYLNF